MQWGLGNVQLQDSYPGLSTVLLLITCSIVIKNGTLVGYEATVHAYLRAVGRNNLESQDKATSVHNLPERHCAMFCAITFTCIH